jgi:hypothetical protein
MRAKLAENAGEYRWSSFASHGNGRTDELLTPIPAYDLLGSSASVRQRRWSAYVHRTPDEAELAAIRRSNETGLPYGERSWTERLCNRLHVDLIIRPRGRPRKKETTSS